MNSTAPMATSAPATSSPANATPTPASGNDQLLGEGSAIAGCQHLMDALTTLNNATKSAKTDSQARAVFASVRQSLANAVASWRTASGYDPKWATMLPDATKMLAWVSGTDPSETSSTFGARMTRLWNICTPELAKVLG